MGGMPYTVAELEYTMRVQPNSCMSSARVMVAPVLT